MPDFSDGPAPLRISVFLGLLLGLLALEAVFPRRGGARLRRLRWPANLGLVAIDTLMLAALPLAAAGTALWAGARGLGLFNWLDWPAWLELLLAWLALDFALYLQHRALHEWRLLWPLHRVHHSDIEFDATTGVRFHPVEILLSMLWKMLLIAALGAPLAAVLIFEIALSSFALFSHANLRLPPRLDAALRRIVITPETHRVHHSLHRDETDSNYGNCLVLWDHLFNSFRAQPRDGHAAMQIGLPFAREPAAQALLQLLAQPLQRRAHDSR